MIGSMWWTMPCLLLLFSVACGGKSELQRGPGPGGASAGGAAATDGGSSLPGAGVGATASSECPVEPPSQGATCNHSGSQCNYQVDKCSSVGFECQGGAWSPVPQSDGASYECSSFQSPNLPHDGDGCECFGQLDCYFEDCSDRGQLHAICDNTTWHVKQTACAGPPCGPNLSCAVGEVCVIHVGFAPTFSCAPDECARVSKPVACDCAGSLCSKSELCSTDSGAIACSCPTCI